MQRRLRTAALIVLLAAAPVPAASAGPGPQGPAGDIDWSKAITVTVLATEYRFEPDHLSLHHGQAYRLHLENRGVELHELTAPDFYRAAAIRNPDILAAGGTDLVVQPREQKDLYLVPLRPGHYPFICADHDFAGMVGTIDVD